MFRNILLLSIFHCLLASPGFSRELHFIENKGQVRDQFGKARKDIQFMLGDGSFSLFVGNGNISYQWSRSLNRTNQSSDHEPKVATEFSRIDAELIGANRNAITHAEEMLPYFEHYYNLVGHPQGIEVHSYKRVVCKNVYPYIDRVFYINNGKAEYDFIIREGGDISDIRISYKGAKEITLDDHDGLFLKTDLGTVIEAAPRCFQANGKEIASRYRFENGVLAFEAAKYSGELSIDPVLDWATYYGGSQDEGPFYGENAVRKVVRVATDLSGNVYMLGNSRSAGNIATTGAHQQVLVGGPFFGDAFLAKFNNAGQRIWATYYGGTGDDQIGELTCDMPGNIFICGTTGSFNGITTLGSHQEFKTASTAAFLVKFNDQGQRLWATYFGSGSSTSHTSEGNSVACDELGNVYLAGSTRSPDSLATIGAYDASLNSSGLIDAYLAKFTSSGTLLWATYYGGLDYDLLAGVSCDMAGSVYICGHTNSQDSIATIGSHQTTLGGPTIGVDQGDCYLAKFNYSGGLQWGTYYGGSRPEKLFDLACNENSVCIVGETSSFNNIATVGSFHDTYNVDTSNFGNVGFLVKFSNAGVREWGTYYCDSLSYLYDVAIGSQERIYIGGSAMEAGDYSTPCGPQQNCIGCWLTTGANWRYNGILAAFDPGGERLWASYYGSADIGANLGTRLHSVATSSSGDLYFAGMTKMSTGIATSGAHQTTYGGGNNDLFLGKFVECVPLPQPLSIAGPTTICEGSSVWYVANVSDTCDIAAYNWTLPVGWAGSSSGDSILVTIGANPGNISVGVENLCGQSSGLQTISVMVSPALNPVITQSGSVISTGTYTTYQWYLNGNPISGATNQSYTMTQGGSYTVVVTDANGCNGTSAALLDVQSFSAPRDISVYPDPSNGTFTVAAASTINQLEIRDALGRQIFSSKPNTVLTTVGLDVPSGLYYITTQTANQRITQKIVIAK